jgi:hypothetical protein
VKDEFCCKIRRGLFEMTMGIKNHKDHMNVEVAGFII